MNLRSIAGLFLIGMAVLIPKFFLENLGIYVNSFLTLLFCVGIFLYLYKNHPLNRIGLLLMAGGPFLCGYLAKNILPSEIILLLSAIIVGLGYYLFQAR
jgi:hypothetical protein